MSVGRRGNPCIGQHSIRQPSISWQDVYDIIKQIYVVQVYNGAINQNDVNVIQTRSRKWARINTYISALGIIRDLKSSKTASSLSYPLHAQQMKVGYGYSTRITVPNQVSYQPIS
jgi:hypothetical protein